MAATGFAGRDDDALFAFNVGPDSWKSHLFPATLTLCGGRARDDQGALSFEAGPRNQRPTMRSSACGPAIWRRSGSRTVFDHGYRDADYEARRSEAGIVVVNCAKAGGTCFCVSMKTGPKAERGFDLALTELLDGAATISWSRSAATEAPS